MARSMAARYTPQLLAEIELSCQALLVYTAVPGSERYGKLQLLAVIGAEALR